MRKLKDSWNQFSYEIRNMLLKYPSTIGIIVIITILSIILVDTSDGFLLETVLPFLGYFGVGLFFSESAYYGNLRKKIIAVAGSLLIAVIFVYKEYGYHDSDVIVSNDSWFLRIRIAYIIVFMIYGIYFCFKRSGYCLSDYGIKIFSNLIKTHIIYVILSIGALIVSAIIEILFLNDYDIDIITRIMILVMGLFYAPSWIFAFSQVQSKIDTFTKIVVKYVLLLLTILIFGIIYIYILKILITQSIPSNEIFSILTGVFIIAMPTWTMLEALEEWTFFGKIARKLPLVFAPLILLQIYSVGVRIMDYGITPDRYMGIMWIILEIIYFLIYWIKHNYIGKMFIVAIFFVIISLLAPMINMYSVSFSSQRKILEQYSKEKNISNEMKQEIYGAYEYISELEKGKKYIDEKFTSDEIKEIEGYYNEYDDRNEYSSELYIGIEKKVSNIEIEGYSTMQVVECNTEYGDSGPEVNNIEFHEYGTDIKVIKADLKNLTDGYVEYALKHQEKGVYYVNVDSYYENNYEVPINENVLLVIRSIDITYDKETEKIKDLNIVGYLFQKNGKE